MNQSSKIAKAKKLLILKKLYDNQMKIALNIFALIHNDGDAEINVVQNETFLFFETKTEELLNMGRHDFWLGIDSHTFNILKQYCVKRAEKKVKHATRIAIFLKYTKEGISQNALAKTVGLGQSTISRIISEMIEDIVAHANEHIKFPSTADEIESSEQRFLAKKKHIRCFGVLDGKHWRIMHPPNSGSLNFNYKHFFSFNSLAVTDAEYRVNFLQITELGINSDAQLYNHGPLPGLLKKASDAGGVRCLPNSQTLMPPFLLADNGFALTHSIMQPYRSTKLTTENIKFNRQLSSVRVIVENSFGVISSRFRLFEKPMSLEPSRARAIVVACCVLHNIIIGPAIINPSNALRPILLNPYRNPEDQRTALKQYVLARM